MIVTRDTWHKTFDTLGVNILSKGQIPSSSVWDRQCFEDIKTLDELDGVGPVDNRPSTDKLHHFVPKKKKRKNMWHVTCDMWHVTCDVTLDTWHETCLGGWTFSQNFSSLALTVCDFWYYEDLEEKDESLN